MPLLEKDIATRTSTTGGSVTRGMLRQRAVEIAVSHGRCAQTVAKSDWEQAKQELLMNRARTRDWTAMNDPALEQWENEGGVVPATSDA